MHRLLEFRQPAVRDLAWVILSPPMIASSVDGVSCATQQWCADQFEEFLGPLKELEHDPAPLMEALQHEGHQKLGKYFENLIAYWLDSNPRYDLLARNLQIRDAKKTYGELDLIVHDRQTGRTGHWEVAVKYYLELGQAGDLSSWIGPNRRDNLARKSQHLMHHQAKRCEHPAARELLANRGLEVDDAFVLLKGHLFYGASARGAVLAPAPTDADVVIHPNHEYFWWRTCSEFKNIHGDDELSWFELVKPNWFTSQSGISGSAAMQPWSPASCTGPNLIVGMRDDIEIERGFVVPDGWLDLTV